MTFPDVTLGTFSLTNPQVSLTRDGEDKIRVGVIITVQAVDGSGPCYVHNAREYPLEVAEDPKQLAVAIKEVFVEFLNHEIDENLRIDGDLANIPYHKPAVLLEDILKGIP